jgi:hypothetical protein
VFRVESRSDAKEGMNESALPDHVVPSILMLTGGWPDFFGSP